MKYIHQPKHEMLKHNTEQHRKKSIHSKTDDNLLRESVKDVVQLLQETFPNHNFKIHKSLSAQEISSFVQRENFFLSNHKIVPDGGIIWMDGKYPVLISEMKYQGSNQERMAQGKMKQAIGNAIERYGKNVMALQSMFNSYDFMSCVVFCWGCDFETELVQSKMIFMNDLYPLNRIYEKTHVGIKPHNIFIQTTPWTKSQMVDKMFDMAKKYSSYFLEKEGE